MVRPEPVVQQEQVPAPIHTATIGIQADNTVINGEDFTIDSTPVSRNINNDPFYNELIAMTDKQPKHYLLVSYYFFPNSSMKHIKHQI